MNANKLTSINTFMLVSLIFSMPVVLLNIQYFDDIARTVVGYYGWSNDGRPLVDIIYKLLSLNGNIVDLYPLPQIASYLLLGYACHLLSYRFGLGVLPGVAITAPIICSPMLVGNTLFRYDSISMAISMFLCVIPLTYTFKSNVIKIVSTSALILTSLMLYQAAFSIFILLSLVSFSYSLIHNGDFKLELKALVFNALSTIIGYCLYVISSSFAFNMSPSAAGRSSLISFDSTGFDSFIMASKKSLMVMFGSYPSLLIYIVATILTLSISYKIISSNVKKYKIQNLSLCIFAMVLCVPVTFFLVVLTKHPAIYPRSYMSFGFLVFGVYLIIYTCGMRKIAVSLSCITVVLMLSFNAKILHAVEIVNRSQMDAAKMIAWSLKENGGTFEDVVIATPMGAPKEITKIYDEHYYANRIIWMHFTNQFASYLVSYNGYKIGLPSKKTIEIVKSHTSDWSVIDSNNIFTLYAFDKHAVVEFK